MWLVLVPHRYRGQVLTRPAPNLETILLPCRKAAGQHLGVALNHDRKITVQQGYRAILDVARAFQVPRIQVGLLA